MAKTRKARKVKEVIFLTPHEASYLGWLRQSDKEAHKVVMKFIRITRSSEKDKSDIIAVNKAQLPHDPEALKVRFG